MSDQSWKNGGIEENKYIIRKANGDEVDPDASYFILRYDTDPHAREALRTYAESVQEQNPQFAKEIFEQLHFTQEKFKKSLS